MATLADVIRQRRSSGQSRTGSLLGSIKEKFAEAIDPRQIFNQTGILTALFPSLKAFKAKGTNSSISSKLLPTVRGGIADNQSEQLKSISRNTEIAAKNYLVLPIIARDVNVMKQNVIKMARRLSTSTSKPDAFFLKQKEVEKLYETNVQKGLNEESQLERVEKKKPFNWIRFLGLVGIGVTAALVTDFLIRKEDSIVYTLYNDAKKLVDDFTQQIKIFVATIYGEIETAIDKSVNLVNETLENLIGSFDDVSLSRAFTDLLDTEKSIFDQFDEKLTEARKKISEGMRSFSIIPSAQAAMLPSAPLKEPDIENIFGTKSVAPITTQKSPARISSPFGMRMHPVHGVMKMHKGIDVAVQSGTPIKSAQRGEVVFSGEQRGYGYSVEVQHEDMSRTFYAHLSRRDVNVGDIVTSGQVIGLSGGGRNDPGRGTSTGPHLHFELRRYDPNTSRYVAVNPGDSLALSTISNPELTDTESIKRAVASSLMENSAIYSDGEYTISPSSSVVINNQNNVMTKMQNFKGTALPRNVFTSLITLHTK
jgi:murein DD-endopeptidase MepM/ murein hydrolase activator NlpD